MYVLTRVRFLLALELGGFGMRWYTVQEVVRGDRREGEGTGGRERGQEGGRGDRREGEGTGGRERGQEGGRGDRREGEEGKGGKNGGK